MKNILKWFGALVFGALVLVTLYNNNKTQIVQAGVDRGSEYIATTTGQGGGFTGGVARVAYDLGDPNATIAGTLGSIYFATVTTAPVDIYDATTTDITLRTGNLATTSLLLASFPSGTGTSTVALDVRYRYGVIAVFKGTVSSTTITTRQ